MLRKKTNGVAKGSRAGSLLSSLAAKTLDRRQFLTTSGVAVGGLAALSLSSGRVEAAAPTTGGGEVVVKKSVCTHCSVGCTVEAEVQNGTWIGQEPGWDSPFNLGAHCAKGASVREHAHGERRLKSPMKMVNGQWQKISWDTAINEIGDKMLEIRE